MIRNAKVSLAAVKTFEQSVSTAKDYSSKFERGIFFIFDKPFSHFLLIDTLNGFDFPIITSLSINVYMFKTCINLK